jgi:hypothetical protein
MSPPAATEDNISTITAKLIGLILKMPLEERRQLLTEVERHHDGQKSFIRRKHTRKNHLIHVDYTVKNRLFNGFAINLSANGVFIESPKNVLPTLSKKDQVILSFDHPEKKEHLKVSGEIARIDAKGIGIKFDQAIMDWWTV